MRVVGVSKWTARNPIARAVAQKALRESALGSKARIFSLTEGEQDSSFIDTLARFMAVTLIAAERDQLPKRDDANYVELIQVVEHALDLLVGMATAEYRWAYRFAADVADAVDACTALAPKLSATAVNQAWHATELRKVTHELR